ncbi:MAG: acetyl-CoA C-acetyltransferase [Deltaproteobacteria bacterium]|nr:MAG: acetyl-CoA C-acetyltransferase [Deltaproteobacteria bacterium]
MSLDLHPRDLVILSAVRTPFGTMGGTLKGMTATDLAVASATPALERAGIRGEDVDHVIYGNVLQTSNDAIYLARHVGLRAGVPQEVPAITLNRLCGSGFQAVVSAAEQILTGQSSVVLCGGTESMSQAPHVTYGLRDGARFGRPPKMQDLLWECLTDTFTGLPMAMTAEKLGDREGVTRADADAYAALSQKRWAAAHDAGHFADELAPVTVKTRKGEVLFETDEHPRPSSTSESLAKLPSVFKKDGLVTAGNASGIGDGSASLVLADAKWAEERGLTPLARLTGWGVSGCDPEVMGIGPVPASKRAFAQTGLGLEDMDLVEVNEAFAPQVVAVERVLGIDRQKLNIYGGAIPMTHPLAASGARITVTLVHALRRRGERYGLGSACIGGGQGIAVIVEAL